MQIGPQRRTGDVGNCCEHVVVVVPVDAEVDETEDVSQQDRQVIAQRIPGSAVWGVQLQHHDRDENGDCAVAKSFKPVRGHTTRLTNETAWWGARGSNPEPTG